MRPGSPWGLSEPCAGPGAFKNHPTESLHGCLEKNGFDSRRVTLGGWIVFSIIDREPGHLP